MRATGFLSVLSVLGGGAVAAASSVHGGGGGGERGGAFRNRDQFERALSDSEDMSFDDDFWGFDQGSTDVVWDDYSMEPTRCMVYKGDHVVYFDLYGQGHNQCRKKKQGTYIMDAGKFAKAYVAQMQVDSKLAGNDYDFPEALDYLECTAVEYNDVYYYVKLGCSGQNSFKLNTYSDEYCSQEVNQNVGLYNDVKVSFNVCQTCVSWPAENNGDDDAGGDDALELDDNFENYHAYDSKLCGAADYFKQSCGWGCRRAAKKQPASGSGNLQAKAKGWGGFEKFCLFVWIVAAVALVWVVLKQRRMMSREDAIVEEAAMKGVGLKKRHIFPISLGIVFLIIMAMFMIWKKLTWFLLIGTNAGLFAHFVFLRRKAKKSGAGGDGYIKDAGLEIS